MELKLNLNGKLTRSSSALITTFVCILTAACTQFPASQVGNTCGAWVFGIAHASKEEQAFAGGEAADQLSERCSKTIYAKGFAGKDLPPDGNHRRSLSDSQLASPATLQAAGQQNALPIYTIRLDTYRLKLKTSAGWQSAPSPNNLYQYFAIQPEQNAGMFVSMYDANPFFIWSDVRASMHERIMLELSDTERTRYREWQMAGDKAQQIEFRGKDRHGAPLHFLTTLLRHDKKIFYIGIWSFETEFSRYRDDYLRMIDSVKIEKN